MIKKQRKYGLIRNLKRLSSAETQLLCTRKSRRVLVTTHVHRLGVKSKEGTVIMEKEKVLKHWIKFIGELFHDNRGEKPTIHKIMDGSKILIAEVNTALAQMKR